MSEFSDRTVTFEPLIRGDNPNAVASVNFTIEPPINVHNADFLSDAVKGLGWDNMQGDFPIISAAKVNYSDDESTHGVVKVEAYTQPELFQSLVEKSFVPALSLGSKTVQLVFKTEA
jgi:hypothetical protein